MSKKTVIIGSSPNPSRYAFMAAQRLVEKSHTFVPVGIKKGKVIDEEILDIRQMPEISNVHTVTMYLNPTNQKPYGNYIESLAPKRVIFNPGTENPEFAERLKSKGIETVEGCTLVMLSVGNF